MSRNDFEQCAPSEFYEIWSRWASLAKDKERGEWERTRVLAMFAIQPYSKKRLTAHDVLPFPWDSENETEAEELSSEEVRARFDAARKRYGLK